MTGRPSATQTRARVPLQRGHERAPSLPKPALRRRLTATWQTLRSTRGLTLRYAAVTDVPEIVDIDLHTFDRVYREYDQDHHSIRDELLDKFAKRLDNVAKWTPVVLDRGKIVGFMMGCPTHREPEDFTTWEEMTDNGTLQSTYSSAGRNVYIATLSIVPERSSTPAKSMLFAAQVGRIILNNADQAFFESRLPGLRSWAERHCRQRGVRLDELSEHETTALAQTYFNLTRTINGKAVPYDRLLRIYHEVGSKFVKLVPGAYRDHPSMDFGVLTVFPNPLPSWARRRRVVRNLIGRLILLAARSPMIARRMF